jgi:hypothetical protein
VKADPWVYDPDGLGIATSAWTPRVGNPGHGLYLTKDGATTANTASGATITGVEGKVLTELGFDYRNDGHCGAGAPRFNVYTTDDTYYFLGCIYGTHTAAGADWTRVRFGDADAVAAGAVA